MKPPLCPHDWAQGLHGRPVLLTQHSPPLLPPEAGTQHMRDLSSAVLRKLVELSPGLDDVDMVPPEPPTMSDELFLTLHLLYSGLCTSVDVYGLPAAGDGAATYFGTRPPAGYGVRPRAARAAPRCARASSARSSLLWGAVPATAGCEPPLGLGTGPIGTRTGEAAGEQRHHVPA